MHSWMLEVQAKKDVFEKLYEEKRQMLYLIARQRVNSDTEAEDAVHICFLRLAENYAKYRHLTYEKLVMLCCKITKNAAIDIARGYKKRRNITYDTSYHQDGMTDFITLDSMDKIIENYDNQILVQALMELKEDERELLFLQYDLGLKPKNIGQLMGLSSSVVRKKMFVCRKKLAKILVEKGYGNIS